MKPYSRDAEKEIQAFWKKEKIHSLSTAKNKNGQPFFLVDGPPFPTGTIHLGTALNKTIKDTIMRSRRMQGFDVFDRAGWDCHGLPTELKVEKKLGLSGRHDVGTKVSVEQLVNECKSFSTEFIHQMTGEFENLGVWMDFENAYKTLDNSYIESIWWTFKQATDKGLLYRGVYPIQVCPQCESPLSFNEIEHRKQNDIAIYVKLQVKGKPNTFLVIWTTTPWTLPANMGVMVHPEFEYAYVRGEKDEEWIVAKERVADLEQKTKQKLTVLKMVEGRSLDKVRYEPIFDWVKDAKFFEQAGLSLEDQQNAFRVITSSRYVTLDTGTGLVHCAPGHGKEDYAEGKKAGLPVLSPVDVSGTFTNMAGKYSGKKVKEANKEIIADLEKSGQLIAKEEINHEYPICWRCSTPLLTITIPQWFLKTESLRKKALEANQHVNWVPDWVRERFGNWLSEGVSDWPVTRDRYWGAPAPIWLCECGNQTIIGSVKELKEKGNNYHDWEKLELHKPWIDAITLQCDKCQKSMKRVPEILDGWFDAGIASWAALNYPHEIEPFAKYWATATNVEGRDQIRGWWNSQLMTCLMAFNHDRAPFQTAAMHGFFLDLGKKKMSKSIGNIVSPEDVINAENRDVMRYYFVQLLKGEDIVYTPDVFKEVNKVFTTLLNAFAFAELNFKPSFEMLDESALKELAVEDQWIISRLEHVREACLQGYREYDFERVTRSLDVFIVEEFSRVYIKLIRDDVKKERVQKTLNHVLSNVLQIMAPITPHLTEHVYQQFAKKNEQSVHLTRIPPINPSLIQDKLETEFAFAQNVATAFLSLREKNAVRLRWRLMEAKAYTKTGNELGRVKNVLERLTNATLMEESMGSARPKDWATMEGEDYALAFNPQPSPELRDEWELSELLRKIQDLRKEHKCTPGQVMKLEMDSDDAVFVKKFTSQIEAETSVKIVATKIDAVKERLLTRSFAFRLQK